MTNPHSESNPATSKYDVAFLQHAGEGRQTSVEETATALGIAPRTVKRDWNVARGWLRREMLDGGLTPRHPPGLHSAISPRNPTAIPRDVTTLPIECLRSALLYSTIDREQSGLAAARAAVR